MANPTSPKGLGLTPAKGALIAVLAVVLVGVLYLQFGGGSDPELTAELVTKQPASASRTSPRAKAESPKAEISVHNNDAEAHLTEFDPTRWETPELSKVIAFDPFARPTKFPQPKVMTEGDAVVATNTAAAEQRAKALAEAVEKLQKQLQQLQQRGVQVIVGGGRDSSYVAVIGNRTVHVGDTIDGFTVTAIEPDGVQVEQTELE